MINSIKYFWYNSVKLFLKIGLHFYAKKIKIIGKGNIPKKGAILFAINHPNALMDPLFVTTFNPRENHFLVRADVFKKPLIKKALASLNLMPIYRIRDGRQQLSNNQEIFEKCFNILKRKETLIIFPQGGHSRDRNIKPLSKGFTRIVFGALEQNPDLNIAVIPVGITYQNSSNYPCKVCVQFGKVINSRKVFEKNPKPKAIHILKEKVSNQLKELTVHIPDNENYQTILNSLNNANVDFTKVDKINAMIRKNSFPKSSKKSINLVKPLFYIILFNSFFPYCIWKKMSKNIGEIEFIDTMKFAINVISFPLFYTLQALVISIFFEWKIASIYWLSSVLLVFIYTKCSPTNTEEN
jgi:1-acyl-sn-glycerol-3-phosphate acyltransferase